MQLRSANAIQAADANATANAFRAFDANGENADPNISNVNNSSLAANITDEKKSNGDDDRKPATALNEPVTNRLSLLEAKVGNHLQSHTCRTSDARAGIGDECEWQKSQVLCNIRWQ